ncbi:phosphoribosyl-ATP diphosphatase [Alphaproteobacteria bacterium LSUCC0684]
MDTHILDRLYAVIEERKSADPEESWTARLLAEAPALPARKLGEEAAETIIEAMRGDSAALKREAADLIYHLMVVLAAAGVRPEDVWRELEQRENQSGLVEKASR